MTIAIGASRTWHGSPGLERVESGGRIGSAAHDGVEQLRKVQS